MKIPTLLLGGIAFATLPAANALHFDPESPTTLLSSIPTASSTTASYTTSRNQDSVDIKRINETNTSNQTNTTTSPTPTQESRHRGIIAAFFDFIRNFAGISDSDSPSESSTAQNTVHYTYCKTGVKKSYIYFTPLGTKEAVIDPPGTTAPPPTQPSPKYSNSTTAKEEKDYGYTLFYITTPWYLTYPSHLSHALLSIPNTTASHGLSGSESGRFIPLFKSLQQHRNYLHDTCGWSILGDVSKACVYRGEAGYVGDVPSSKHIGLIADVMRHTYPVLEIGLILGFTLGPIALFVVGRLAWILCGTVLNVVVSLAAWAKWFVVDFLYQVVRLLGAVAWSAVCFVAERFLRAVVWVHDRRWMDRRWEEVELRDVQVQVDLPSGHEVDLPPSYEEAVEELEADLAWPEQNEDDMRREEQTWRDWVWEVSRLWLWW